MVAHAAVDVVVGVAFLGVDGHLLHEGPLVVNARSDELIVEPVGVVGVVVQVAEDLAAEELGLQLLAGVGQLGGIHQALVVQGVDELEQLHVVGVVPVLLVHAVALVQVVAALQVKVLQRLADDAGVAVAVVGGVAAGLHGDDVGIHFLDLAAGVQEAFHGGHVGGADGLVDALANHLASHAAADVLALQILHLERVDGQGEHVLGAELLAHGQDAVGGHGAAEEAGIVFILHLVEGDDDAVVGQILQHVVGGLADQDVRIIAGGDHHVQLGVGVVHGVGEVDGHAGFFLPLDGQGLLAVGLGHQVTVHGAVEVHLQGHGGNVAEIRGGVLRQAQRRQAQAQAQSQQQGNELFHGGILLCLFNGHAPTGT